MTHLSNLDNNNLTDLTIDNNKLTGLTVPAFDHKEPEDDDCGLPEDPIFSNFSKYLWQSHARLSGVQSPKRSRENTDGPENAG
jgi:hypothetical protein